MKGSPPRQPTSTCRSLASRSRFATFATALSMLTILTGRPTLPMTFRRALSLRAAIGNYGLPGVVPTIESIRILRAGFLLSAWRISRQAKWGQTSKRI